MEVRKILFKKHNDIIQRYDKKLVLKNFVKEQHRKLGNLDLWSHRKLFYDPIRRLYNYPDIMNFIGEATREAAAKCPILTAADL